MLIATAADSMDHHGIHLIIDQTKTEHGSPVGVSLFLHGNPDLGGVYLPTHNHGSVENDHYGIGNKPCDDCSPISKLP